MRLDQTFRTVADGETVASRSPEEFAELRILKVYRLSVDVYAENRPHACRRASFKMPFKFVLMLGWTD